MVDLDLTQSVEPKSDQINADTLIPGRITVTIKTVRAGSKEQPFDFLLDETPLAYRPSKSMRRVIIAAWGPKTSAYTGRRLTLYREPSITFGGQKVGGIRIAAMSDIPGPLQVAFQVTKGKSETVTVQPLSESSTGTAVVQGRGEHVSAGESPASANRGAVGDESAASPEPLLAAVNRQIKDLAASGSTAFLSTFCQSQTPPINPTSKALVEAFGEAARDLRGLMAIEADQ